MRKKLAELLLLGALLPSGCKAPTTRLELYRRDLTALAAAPLSSAPPFRLEIVSSDLAGGEERLLISLLDPVRSFLNVRLIIAPQTPKEDGNYPNLGYFEDEPIAFAAASIEGYRCYRKLNFALVGPPADRLALFFYDGAAAHFYEVKS